MHGANSENNDKILANQSTTKHIDRQMGILYCCIPNWLEQFKFSRMHIKYTRDPYHERFEEHIVSILQRFPEKPPAKGSRCT